MARTASTIKEVFKYEPLLIDLLEHEINEQHARILAMLFKLGGFTTLNKLTKLLSFAQPTVSIRVAELVEMGYVRKNSELMPMTLVLLLNLDDLETQLRKRIEHQRNAIKFLCKISQIQNKQLGKDTFNRAMQTIFTKDRIMSNLIAYTYLHEIIARTDLYHLLEVNFGDSKRLESDFDLILACNIDILHIIYRKQQKREMFIRPRLPLELFANYRLTYLESLYSHYQQLLNELTNLMTGEYESIIPHQQLKYPSDIKLRIDTCLKHYLIIRIIDNSIYLGKDVSSGLLKLITESKYYSPKHKIMILSNNIQIPKGLNDSQIGLHSLNDDISQDYKTRDFILFNNHGVLVFPSRLGGIPYYNIAPRFIATIKNIFDAYWG
ncbi:MAG: hypothetical protein ACFFCQ_15930 [Promethearchaeota archaeon]